MNEKFKNENLILVGIASQDLKSQKNRINSFLAPFVHDKVMFHGVKVCFSDKCFITVRAILACIVVCDLPAT